MRLVVRWEFHTVRDSASSHLFKVHLSTVIHLPSFLTDGQFCMRSLEGLARCTWQQQQQQQNQEAAAEPTTAAAEAAAATQPRLSGSSALTQRMSAPPALFSRLSQGVRQERIGAEDECMLSRAAEAGGGGCGGFRVGGSGGERVGFSAIKRLARRNTANTEAPRFHPRELHL